jgi:hypothetical protein
LDVSVGLMQAPSGARAEDWLGWKLEKVEFEEFSHNKPLTNLLSGGMKRWNAMGTGNKVNS